MSHNLGLPRDVKVTVEDALGVVDKELVVILGVDSVESQQPFQQFLVLQDVPHNYKNFVEKYVEIQLN